MCAVDRRREFGELEISRVVTDQHGLRFLAQVDIDTVEKFESLRATEQQYFTDMVQKCKDSGACLLHVKHVLIQVLFVLAAWLPTAQLCPRPGARLAFALDHQRPPLDQNSSGSNIAKY